MDLRLPRNSSLARALGPSWLGLLEEAFAALSRILPHTETSDWQFGEGPTRTRVTFSDQTRKALSLAAGITIGNRHWSIEGRLARRSNPDGVGAISRTIDVREKDIANSVVQEIGEMFSSVRSHDVSTAHALRQGIDERVVARHLRGYHGLEIDLGEWFVSLRQLAEQSYENKALTFGCIIHTDDGTLPSQGLQFPTDFLERKRYKALSDGYRTVYRVSARGPSWDSRTFPAGRLALTSTTPSGAMRLPFKAMVCASPSA